MKSKTVEYIKIDSASNVSISWREHRLQVTGFDTDSCQGFDFELYCRDDQLFKDQGYAMQQVAEEVAKRYPDRFFEVASEKGFVLPEKEESEEAEE